MTRDYRDDVIEVLGDENAALRARVDELDADRRTYRAIALATFDALRDLTARQHALLDAHAQHADEARRQREEWLLQAGADDPEEAAA